MVELTPELRALAARQLADYRARTPGTAFADPEPPVLTLEQAYAVQDEVAALRAAQREPIAGYKVGCTGPGTRAQFGLDGPIRGVLYKTELHRSPAEVSAAGHANLAVEGELAVRLGADARPVQVLPVIELHNYVFRGRRPTLQELVVNNGIHAGVVLPDEEGAPWRDQLPSGRLRVEVNGVTVDEGPIDGVPGGPLGSLAWLRDHLAAHGRSLEPHQLVLTGTPIRLILVRPGDAVRVTAEGVGSVGAAVVA